MADHAKYTSLTKTETKTTIRKTVAFCVFLLVGFTTLLLVNPSPWLKNFFQTSSNRPYFPSLFFLFLPINSSQSNCYPVPVSQLQGNPCQNISQETEKSKDWSLSSEGKSGNYPFQISPESERSPSLDANVTNSLGNSSQQTGKESKGSNMTLDGSNDIKILGKLRKGNLMEIMSQCRMFDGKWVRDDSYPLYVSGSCPHIGESFNCFLNGRPDREYEKYRWQPDGCNLPRLNGKHMLELLRGKRVVFVGDSVGRNMWESLVCILRNSVEGKRKASSTSRHDLQTMGPYSLLFRKYNCSIEYIKSHFLVQEWQILHDTNGSKKETLRLDMIDKLSDEYKNADVLIFNTGHWWTHDKTSKGKGYYQEGSTIYDELNVDEAYRKALTTWATWIDSNIDPMKTLVFFRGFSATHFWGGRWDLGGKCHGETEPITNDKFLKKYPLKMQIFESVLNGMTTPILYLNVSRMTGFRKDGHPSIYRRRNLTVEERIPPTKIQDCSHWCLPGVPDAWNELLYAQLLVKDSERQQQLLHHEEQQRRS
ncbi:hypothetical protein CCACVL1_01820 [Corchorus capsularis]|uniref:Uncharacterized protein n=1 Tax=Corchorus capsularis TaxID=210143 RepID=A0A1R3KFF0_COCAP|nr:hypothetical protein CCACVL1_01820 [Corchorus capsularis]